MTRRTPLLLTLALFAFGALAVPGAALARKGDGPRAEMNLRMLERAAERLELDDATLTAIKDQVYEAEKAGIDLKAQLERAKLELRRVLDQDTPAKGDVMSRIDEVGRLETALRKHQIGLMIDVKAMLTPEQRKALKKMTRRGERRRGKAGRRGKGKDRGERGPDGRRGPPPDPFE